MLLLDKMALSTYRFLQTVLLIKMWSWSEMKDMVFCIMNGSMWVKKVDMGASILGLNPRMTAVVKRK